MIASTFWKNTIHGAISCDQSTFFDSSSCSRKLPAVWKNFFGTIGARSRDILERQLASGRPRHLAALEVLAHRGHVELDDPIVAQLADEPVVEGDELHATPQTRCATSA